MNYNEITLEEAIHNLEVDEKFCQASGSRNCEEFKIAISCIEKQIAKEIDNKEEDDLVYGCHCCGEINALWKMNGDKNKYCGNCGQKIKW